MGKSAAERLERALTTLAVDHDIRVYPEAGHGFINNHDPADMTPLLAFLSRISGTATTSRPPPMRTVASPPSSAAT